MIIDGKDVKNEAAKDNERDTTRLASILLNMSLDMDGLDYAEYYDSAVADLKSELDKLDSDSPLLSVLETIADEHKDMDMFPLNETER